MKEFMCSEGYEFKERLVRMVVCFLTIFSYIGIVIQVTAIGKELDLTRFGIIPSKYDRMGGDEGVGERCKRMTNYGPGNTN